MKSTPQSERILDRHIAVLEEKLEDLRKKKLSLLQARMKEAEDAFRAMQSNLGGGGPGRPKGSKGAKAAKGASGRGGPRGPRMTDEQVLSKLTSVVKAAGSEGISARAASLEAGVFYLRAIKVMDEHFRKTGSAKWTRYFAK
jgi:hypothetical protein